MKINKDDLLRVIASTDGNEINLIDIIPNNVEVKRVDSNGNMVDGFYKRDDGSVLIIESSKELDKIGVMYDSSSTLNKLNNSISFSRLKLSEMDLDVKPIKHNSSEDGFFNAKYYSLFENSFIENELSTPDRSYIDKWKYSTNSISEEELRSIVKSIIGVFNGEVCENYYSSNYIDMPILRNTECQYVIKNILGSQSMSSFDVYPELLYSMYQLGISIEYIFILMVRDHNIKDYYLDLTVDELAGLFNLRFFDTLCKAYMTGDDEIHSFIEYLDYCRYDLINSRSNLTLRELLKDKDMFNY